jgi:hypothetical protein
MLANVNTTKDLHAALQSLALYRKVELLNKTEKCKIFFCVLNNGPFGLYKPYMSSYK